MSRRWVDIIGWVVCVGLVVLLPVAPRPVAIFGAVMIGGWLYRAIHGLLLAAERARFDPDELDRAIMTAQKSVLVRVVVAQQHDGGPYRFLSSVVGGMPAAKRYDIAALLRHFADNLDSDLGGNADDEHGDHRAG